MSGTVRHLTVTQCDLKKKVIKIKVVKRRRRRWGTMDSPQTEVSKVMTVNDFLVKILLIMYFNLKA